MKERLATAEDVPDLIQRLRALSIRGLIPDFGALQEEYAASQIIMEMDGSSFLKGGRGIKIEFQIGDPRVDRDSPVTGRAPLPGPHVRWIECELVANRSAANRARISAKSLYGNGDCSSA